MKPNIISLSLIVLCLLCSLIGILSVNKGPVSYSTSDSCKKPALFFKANTNKIALITIDGVIDSSNKISTFSTEFNAQNALKALRSAREDHNIKGVLIKMNTPGGTVAMSQSIYNEVIRTREIKPVVVVMEDMAASGGYYIASAADRIIAGEGTLTGSIGVIFSTMDLHKLLSEKLLVEPNIIKSGKYKDTGSPYRQMTQDEKNLMQDIVQDSYGQFIKAIKDGRITRNDEYSFEKKSLDEPTLSQYADGRIFTGLQAYKLGFIDAVGDIYSAETALKSMTNQKFKNNNEVVLIPYNRPSGLGELLFGTAESLFNRQNPIESLIPNSIKHGKKLLYLWE